MKNFAIKQNLITSFEVESFIALDETYRALKKRIEVVENNLKTIERELLEKIENGVENISSHDLSIKIVERRYPSWKSHYIAATSAEEAKRVLIATIPLVSRHLIIK